jgi:hypothetical protein
VPPAPVGRKPLRAGHLPLGWRWVLAGVWIVAMGGLGALAQEAFLVDSGPFWLSYDYLPFALPAAAVIALARDSRRAVEWSLLAIAGMAAIGAGDVLSHHRATGLIELAIAASVLVGVVGCALNRATEAPAVDRGE